MWEIFLIAATIGLVLVSLGFLIGKSLAIPSLESQSLSALISIITAGLVLVSFDVLIQLANILVSSFTPGGITTPCTDVFGFEHHDAYICYNLEIMASIEGQIYHALSNSFSEAVIQGMKSSKSLGVGFPIASTNINTYVPLYPLSALSQLEWSFIFNDLMTRYSIVLFLYALLALAPHLGWTLAFLGAIFRPIPGLKKTGGLLLAFGFGFLFILPLSVDFAYSLSRAPIGIQSLAAQNCPDVCMRMPPIAFVRDAQGPHKFYTEAELYEYLKDRGVSNPWEKIDELMASGADGNDPPDTVEGITNCKINWIKCPSICHYIPYPIGEQVCQKHVEDCSQLPAECFQMRNATEDVCPAVRGFKVIVPNSSVSVSASSSAADCYKHCPPVCLLKQKQGDDYTYLPQCYEDNDGNPRTCKDADGNERECWRVCDEYCEELGKGSDGRNDFFLFDKVRFSSCDSLCVCDWWERVKNVDIFSDCGAECSDACKVDYEEIATADEVRDESAIVASEVIENITPPCRIAFAAAVRGLAYPFPGASCGSAPNYEDFKSHYYCLWRLAQTYLDISQSPPNNDDPADPLRLPNYVSTDYSVELPTKCYPHCEGPCFPDGTAHCPPTQVSERGIAQLPHSASNRPQFLSFMAFTRICTDSSHCAFMLPAEDVPRIDYTKIGYPYAPYVTGSETPPHTFDFFIPSHTECVCAGFPDPSGSGRRGVGSCWYADVDLGDHIEHITGCPDETDLNKMADVSVIFALSDRRSNFFYTDLASNSVIRATIEQWIHEEAANGRYLYEARYVVPGLPSAGGHPCRAGYNCVDDTNDNQVRHVLVDTQHCLLLNPFCHITHLGETHPLCPLDYYQSRFGTPDEVWEIPSIPQFLLGPICSIFRYPNGQPWMSTKACQMLCGTTALHMQQFPEDLPEPTIYAATSFVNGMIIPLFAIAIFLYGSLSLSSFFGGDLYIPGLERFM